MISWRLLYCLVKVWLKVTDTQVYVSVSFGSSHKSLRPCSFVFVWRFMVLTAATNWG